MSLYKPENSQFWYVNISVPGHPRVRRSTGTTDRLEAQRIHDEIKAGLWSAPKLTGKTWGDAVVLWCQAPGRGEPDLLRMSKFARFYPDRAIHEVTRENLDAALKKFVRSDASYLRYRNCISAILHGAKEEGWIKEVPKLPTKTVRAKPRTWITHEQWEVLYRHLPPHQQRMALFAIETGLRQANVLGLTWKQVDLDRKLVWVESDETKAKKAIAVPLSTVAHEVLTACKGAHPTFVFTYRGRPITEIKTAFQKACVRAGLGHFTESQDGGTSYEGFTWHGLRHTWATWHIQNGTPVEVLQKLGGWADIKMVLNYAHHSAGFLAQFANNTRRKL